MDETYKFEGNANIYLQGDDALEVSNVSVDLSSYFIVNPNSQITVYDHRPETLKTLDISLTEGDNGEFSEVFSNPAYITIHANGSQAEIQLFELKEYINHDLPTLWLGSINNATMAVHNTIWEILKPISDSIFAFAALIT